MSKIGAFEITTPLGSNIADNWDAILHGKTALKKVQVNDKLEAYISRFENEDFKTLIYNCLKASLSKIYPKDLGKVQLILSATKGAVQDWDHYHKHRVYDICSHFSDKDYMNEPITISNACISGLQAVELAHDGVSQGFWDTAIIIAFDEVSEFILEGFSCFHALSKSICQPFSKDRDGINIGSAVATAIVSKKNIFQKESYEVVSAANCNDANHISGPSRTGEGLYRAINNVVPNGIHPDFISLHGTGTPFNDEMEAIALDRLKLNDIPVHSLKPIFGHTLGAAGLLELAICAEMMKHSKVLPSLNFKEKGTTVDLNVQKEIENRELNCILKTTSGFGGNNAAILMQKND